MNVSKKSGLGLKAWIVVLAVVFLCQGTMTAGFFDFGGSTEKPPTKKETSMFGGFDKKPKLSAAEQKKKAAEPKSGMAKAAGFASEALKNPMIAGLFANVAGSLTAKITGDQKIGSMVSGTATSTLQAHAKGQNVKQAFGGAVLQHGSGVLGSLTAKITGSQEAASMVSGAAVSAGGAMVAGKGLKGAGMAVVASEGGKVAAIVGRGVGRVTGREDIGALVGGLGAAAAASVGEEPSVTDAEEPSATDEQVSAIPMFIEGLQTAINGTDFNAETLAFDFEANGVSYSVEIPLGGVGFGDPTIPFDAVAGTISGEGAAVEELTPLLSFTPEELFVLKLVLMLNSANSIEAGGDFDADDFILANGTMLIARLEQLGDTYTSSSQAAFDAVRDTYKPLLELVQFPVNPWYERVIHDMPGGEPTAFIKSISELRYAVGHTARTSLFTKSVLPQLDKKRNSLEKEYFVYAIKTHLDEYNGGFVSDDTPDFIKRTIDARLKAMQPMLASAIKAMTTAGCDADDIKYVKTFLGGIAKKPRTVDDEEPSRIPVKMPEAPVAIALSGVAYFNNVIDVYLRTQVLHRKLAIDTDYLYFDFAYGAEHALEALVALVIRSMHGLIDVDTLTTELTDIYYRADDDVVDKCLQYLTATNGYVTQTTESVVPPAKEGVTAKVEEVEGTIFDQAIAQAIEESVVPTPVSVKKTVPTAPVKKTVPVPVKKAVSLEPELEPVPVKKTVPVSVKKTAPMASASIKKTPVKKIAPPESEPEPEPEPESEPVPVPVKKTVPTASVKKTAPVSVKKVVPLKPEPKSEPVPVRGKPRATTRATAVPAS